MRMVLFVFPAESPTRRPASAAQTRKDESLYSFLNRLKSPMVSQATVASAVSASGGALVTQRALETAMGLRWTGLDIGSGTVTPVATSKRASTTTDRVVSNMTQHLQALSGGAAATGANSGGKQTAVLDYVIKHAAQGRPASSSRVSRSPSTHAGTCTCYCGVAAGLTVSLHGAVAACTGTSTAASAADLQPVLGVSLSALAARSAASNTTPATSTLVAVRKKLMRSASASRLVTPTVRDASSGHQSPAKHKAIF